MGLIFDCERESLAG